MLPVREAFFSVMFFLIGFITTAKTWLSFEKWVKKVLLILQIFFSLSGYFGTLGSSFAGRAKSQFPCEGESWHQWMFSERNNCRFDLLVNPAALQSSSPCKINSALPYHLSANSKAYCRMLWPIRSSSPELVFISVLSKGSLHDQGRETGGDLDPSLNLGIG